MLQAFRLELQFAAMKRKQQREKEDADGEKNAAGEGSSTIAPSKKEMQGMSGQTDGQKQGAEEVADQVYNKAQSTFCMKRQSIS
jgi:hypothetical protein